MKVKQLAMWFL